jgi:hypothetical protein
MTSLQKTIRDAVKTNGYLNILVGLTSPATMATIKALRRAGYKCVKKGRHEARLCDVWQITLLT